MEDSNGLPLFNAPIDHLKYGLISLESELLAKHPVQQLQKIGQSSDWAVKLDMARRLHGSHMAMRLETERQQFSRPSRLPGLYSSHIVRDTVMGNDTKIDFCDYLNGKIYIFHL